MPYKWSYECYESRGRENGACRIIVGAYQWPRPLYWLQWDSEGTGWEFHADGPVSDDQVLAILESSGYCTREGSQGVSGEP